MIVAFLINSVWGAVVGWNTSEYGTNRDWPLWKIFGVALAIYLPVATVVSLTVRALVRE